MGFILAEMFHQHVAAKVCALAGTAFIDVLTAGALHAQTSAQMTVE